MKDRGVRVTVNEHYGPLTPVNDSHFDTIRQAMGLPPDTKEIPHDLANQKYAKLFMDLLHKPALDDGMAFWWQDGAAPANMEGLDPYLWTRHIEYEGSERITGKRAYAFCRLGLPGAHIAMADTSPATSTASGSRCRCSSRRPFARATCSCPM